MKRMASGVLLLCLLAVLLCGCAGGKEPSSSAPSAGPIGTSTTTSRTELQLLPFGIDELLTKEHVEEVTGLSMNDPQVFENGAQLYFLSEDNLSSVQVDVSQTTFEAFDLLAGQFRDALTVAELGEGAWWSEEAQTLLSYKNGYLVSVTLGLPEGGEKPPAEAAREMAVLVLSKL